MSSLWIFSIEPEIRAVDVYAGFMLQEASESIFKHSNFDRITHFSITGLGTNEKLGRISLPAVQCLRAHIMGTSRPYGGHMANWELPSLTSLYIIRNAFRPWPAESVIEGLEKFMAAHAKNITSLNIELLVPEMRSSFRCPIDEVFWGWFPNLRMLGTGLDALGGVILPPPPGARSTSLLIPAVSPLDITRAPADFSQCTQPLLRACDTLRVKELVLLDSWDSMAYFEFERVTPSGNSGTGWSKHLFEAAK